MRLHPFIAAAVVALVGATAFSANLILGQRAPRAQRVAEPPAVLEEPRAPPAFALLMPPAAAAPAPVDEEPAPTAALRIRVVGPHGLVLPGAEVTAVSADAPEGPSHSLDEIEDDDGDDEAHAPVPPGTYEVDDLEPGRYDVTVEASGMRTAHVRVPTGEEVVTISLARAPILFGAVRAPGDDGCHAGALVVRGPEDEDGDGESAEGSVADDCTFSVDGLPEAGPLTVELRWGDVAAPAARALVTLPVAEDPAFLCLAPPCGAAPASLAIYVADATGRLAADVALEWTLVDETRGELGSTTGSGLLFLHGRRAGETLSLVATVDGGGEARRVAATVVVRPGLTDVLMTLPREPTGESEAPPPNVRRRTIIIDAID
jgi:hypothetical protein